MHLIIKISLQKSARLSQVAVAAARCRQAAKHTASKARASRNHHNFCAQAVQILHPQTWAAGGLLGSEGEYLFIDKITESKRGLKLDGL